MTIYCIDTSTMIDAGERYYPIDVFPGFWEKLDDLIEDNRLKAPKTLLDELEGKDDKWRDWVYERADKNDLANGRDHTGSNANGHAGLCGKRD